MSQNVFENILPFVKGAASLKTDPQGEISQFDAQLAVAMLYVQMARIDGDIDSRESEVFLKALARGFDISEREIGVLVQAVELLYDAPEKLSELLDIVNERFDMYQKISIVADLVRIMRADEIVLPREAELCEKISSFLSLGPDEIIKAIRIAGQ
jgi:uncharacterized tellurite resistance protein B-like protein